MKRFVFIAALLAVVTPGIALATSGACSWHGGVDCAAGPGLYGQVICNDGWTGSSVSYDSMVECQGYNSTPSCPPFSSYDSASDSCKCYPGYVIGSDGSCTSATIVCTEKLGIGAEYDYSTDSCKCSYGDALYDGQCENLNTICRDKHGLDTSYDSLSNSCECDDGYVLDSDGQCTSGDVVCDEKFGMHSTFDSSSNQCGCESGYVLSGSTCVYDSTENSYDPSAYVPTPVEPNPAPSSSVGTDPVQACTDKLGPYGVVEGQNSCGCAEGYALNASQDFCVKESPVVVPEPKKKPTTSFTPISTSTLTSPHVVDEIHSAATSTASSSDALGATLPTYIFETVLSWLVWL